MHSSIKPFDVGPAKATAVAAALCAALFLDGGKSTQAAYGVTLTQQGDMLIVD